MSIQALLDRLGIDGRIVAVECNMVVVRRGKYADTIIPAGAEIEIVRFVGGGSASRRRRPARRQGSRT
jgi:thiamine biosynthesis protein ThiS